MDDYIITFGAAVAFLLVVALVAIFTKWAAR